MAVDVNKIRSVVNALHNEVQSDPNVRKDFKEKPVALLASRGLNLDEIQAIEADAQFCIGITCVGVTCIAFSL